MKKIAFFGLFISLFITAWGFASVDFLSMGKLVQGTPFDYKVQSAGCFSLAQADYEGFRSGQQSIGDLFMTARSFRYASDKADVWQSAEETESRRAGDCEDKAIWLFARLIQNGYYNVRLVIGRYRSIDSQLHVWVICSDKSGNTCLLDPSIQKRVWYLTATDSGFYQALYAYDGQNRYRYFSSN